MPDDLAAELREHGAWLSAFSSVADAGDLRDIARGYEPVPFCKVTPPAAMGRH